MRAVRVPLLAATAGVVLLAGCSAPAPPDGGLTGTVTVLAAASLTDVFGALGAHFERKNPDVDVMMTHGGSSALAEQLVSGAPADVFAAADEFAMRRVVDAARADEPVVFASNTLELAIPAGNPGGVRGLADLARSDLVVALCDPTVPCGSAAARLLDRAGVAASVDTLEQDVRAAITKVALGEVDATLVYRTDVLAAGDTVEGIEVPAADDVVNRYSIAQVRDAPNAAAARAFIDFVLSPTGRAALREAGFGVS